MIKQHAVTTDTSAEPLTLEDMKVFLRVDHDDEDTVIESLIAAARSHVEALTNRSLKERAYTLTLNRFPTRLELWDSPYVSLDSISYYDASNVSQSFDLSHVEYIHQLRTTVKLKPDINAPDTYDRTDAVVFSYTSGYGDSAGECPEALVMAIRQLVSHLYENRMAIGVNVNLNAMPFAVKALCSPYSIPTFA